MQTLAHDNLLVLVLEKGEQVMKSLTAACAEHRVSAGFCTGLGAVEYAEIAYFNTFNKEYTTHRFEETREVVSLVGNIAHVEDMPFVHVHVGLGDSLMQVVGGHLIEATVAVTLEVLVTIVPETTFSRVLREDIGLKLLQLPATNNN